nr:hypothetical protein [Tanacetum cinerariifolium]
RPMTKKQKKEYYMAVIKSNLGWRFKDFKRMTFKEIEAKFVEVWKQVEDFIPMGSKEKTERLKRKEWKLYDLSGVHRLTAKDREIFMLVEKDYPLRRGLALVMISYKLQVENYSHMAEDLIRKIYNIANTPSSYTMERPILYVYLTEGEAAAERISNDSEEVARVLTSMDAATVLAGGIDVPTGSGSIPTAGPPATIISTSSEVGLIASPIVIKRKGKEVMVESDTPKKKKLQEQIDAQGMIDSLDKSNETIAKYLQEYHDFASELSLEKRIELISDLRFKDFKRMTFEEIEAKFVEVWKQVEDFIPMGSKEETERLKRKGLNLEKEQVKKQKSSEEAPEIETSTKEITEEQMKEMMQLVPVKDVYVQALQVKHPIIDWKIHTEE